MFGIGFPELVFIFLVALVLFGPEKLPEIARTLGKITGEFKKGSDAMRREFYNSVYTPSQEWKGRLEQETRNLVSTEPGAEPDEETKKKLEEEKKCLEEQKRLCVEAEKKYNESNLKKDE